MSRTSNGQGVWWICAEKVEIGSLIATWGWRTHITFCVFMAFMDSWPSNCKAHFFFRGSKWNESMVRQWCAALVRTNVNSWTVTAHDSSWLLGPPSPITRACSQFECRPHENAISSRAHLPVHLVQVPKRFQLLVAPRHPPTLMILGFGPINSILIPSHQHYTPPKRTPRAACQYIDSTHFGGRMSRLLDWWRGPFQ